MKILKSDFYLDSFNYFPITENNFSFRNIFQWHNSSPGRYNNFFTKSFSKNFFERRKNFKKFSNAVILGSSPSNDYFRNMMTFLPRIFFISDKEINLVIHRNTSNKFRVFIKEILTQKKIKVKKFIYLDDDFYKFNNSLIPQFFTMAASTIILSKSLSYIKKDSGLKVYLSRQNSDYRNLINEEDVIRELKKKDFEIVDLNNYEIIEQIELFASAKVIISPTSSSLANILFCSRGTKVIEICPKYRFDYENVFKLRYSFICNCLGLNYQSIEADSINLENLDPFTKKFISENVLNESNYYKNLIIKIDNIQNVL